MQTVKNLVWRHVQIHRNAPPGEAPQKERSLMNIVLNSLDKDRVKSVSVFI